MNATSWLLLLYSLPTNRNTERVAVWRRLKKMGAAQIKTSTYLLPDESAQYEQLQPLPHHIPDARADSPRRPAQEIQGRTPQDRVPLSHDARAKANELRPK